MVKTHYGKTTAQLNEFNAAVAKFGLTETLAEIAIQCGHYGDVAQDEGKAATAQAWESVRHIMKAAMTIARMNGLSY